MVRVEEIGRVDDRVVEFLGIDRTVRIAQRAGLDGAVDGDRVDECSVIGVKNIDHDRVDGVLGYDEQCERDARLRADIRLGHDGWLRRREGRVVRIPGQLLPGRARKVRVTDRLIDNLQAEFAWRRALVFDDERVGPLDAAERLGRIQHPGRCTVLDECAVDIRVFHPVVDRDEQFARARVVQRRAEPGCQVRIVNGFRCHRYRCLAQRGFVRVTGARIPLRRHRRARRPRVRQGFENGLGIDLPAHVAGVGPGQPEQGLLVRVRRIGTRVFLPERRRIGVRRVEDEPVFHRGHGAVVAHERHGVALVSLDVERIGLALDQDTPVEAEPIARRDRLCVRGVELPVADAHLLREHVGRATELHDLSVALQAEVEIGEYRQVHEGAECGLRERVLAARQEIDGSCTVAPRIPPGDLADTERAVHDRHELEAMCRVRRDLHRLAPGAAVGRADDRLDACIGRGIQVRQATAIRAAPAFRIHHDEVGAVLADPREIVGSRGRGAAPGGARQRRRVVNADIVGDDERFADGPATVTRNDSHHRVSFIATGKTTEAVKDRVADRSEADALVPARCHGNLLGVAPGRAVVVAVGREDLDIRLAGVEQGEDDDDAGFGPGSFELFDRAVRHLDRDGYVDRARILFVEHVERVRLVGEMAARGPVDLVEAHLESLAEACFDVDVGHHLHVDAAAEAALFRAGAGD